MTEAVPAQLEVYTSRGLQVPWVTRWTSERRSEPYRFTPLGLEYPEPRDDDIWNSVLWQREGFSRGEGEPEWKEMHTGRQRQCMTGPCCQVCGRIIEGKVTWLLPVWEAKTFTRKGRITTTTPPTCAGCIEVARAACPHLSANDGGVAYDVRGYRPVAVFGEVVMHEQRHLGEVQLGTVQSRFVLGKQLIVEIYDWRKRR